MQTVVTPDCAVGHILRGTSATRSDIHASSVLGVSRENELGSKGTGVVVIAMVVVKTVVVVGRVVVPIVVVAGDTVVTRVVVAGLLHVPRFDVLGP